MLRKTIKNLFIPIHPNPLLPLQAEDYFQEEEQPGHYPKPSPLAPIYELSPIHEEEEPSSFTELSEPHHPQEHQLQQQMQDVPLDISLTLQPQESPLLLHDTEASPVDVIDTLAQYQEPSPSAPSPAPEHQEQEHHGSEAPLLRPSSDTSSYATEYYGRPNPKADHSRSAEALAAPAADRLYADYFRKQAILEEQRRIKMLEQRLATQHVHILPVSRALAAHRTAGGYSSYCERLYAEGRMDAMRREAEAAQVKVEEDETELAELTFHPKISKMAQELKMNAARSSSLGAATPWDRLHTQGVTLKKERRAEAIRRQQEEEELKECSFKPKVDRKSAKMVQEKRGAAAGNGLAMYERLYHEGRFNSERVKESAAAWLPEGTTFKPKINRSSVKMVDLVAAAEGDVGGAMGRDVGERLYMRGKKYRARLEAAREAMKKPIDSDGHPFFHPRTTRPPRGIQREGPVGDILYTAARQSQSRAVAQVEEARRQAEQQASTVHITKVSTKLMDKLKKERFKAIFAYLKSAAAPGERGPREINLLGILQDEKFMDTIDPEVRTDLEHAGRLLTKTLVQRAQQAEVPSDVSIGTAPVQMNNFVSDGSDWVLGVAVESMGDPHQVMMVQSAQSMAGSVNSSVDREPLSARESVWAASVYGEITESGFEALMFEVLHRTRGIARQYLQPLPAPRKKWDDPTFKPALGKRSLKMATKNLRPEGVPGHELLYRTAQETAEKIEARRKAREEATLRECSFRPALVSAPLVSKGKALQMALQPKYNADQEKEERELEEAIRMAEAAMKEQTGQEHQQQEWRTQRFTAAKGVAGPQNPQISNQELHTSVCGSNFAASQGEIGGDNQNNNHNKIPSVMRPELYGPGGVGSSAVGCGAAALSHGCGVGAGRDLYYSEDGPALEPVGHSTNNSLEDGIDAIERQIQEAMARLSMTGETFVAHLNGGKNTNKKHQVPEQRAAPMQQRSGGVAAPMATAVAAVPLASEIENEGVGRTPLRNGPALAARLRASLDYHAFFAEEETPAAQTLPSYVPSNAAMSDFNPVQFGADGMTPAHVESEEDDMRHYAAAIPQDTQQRSEPVAGGRDVVSERRASLPKLQPIGASLLAQLAAAPLPEILFEGSGSCC